MPVSDELKNMDLAHKIKSKIDAIYFMVDGMARDYNLGHEGILVFIDETNEDVMKLTEQLDDLFNKSKAEKEALSALVRAIE